MSEQSINFGPVKSVRLFEEICDQVRSQLIGGQIRPGDKLPPERELADQFGVSRAAVREALRSLETSGLIELRKGPKGGAFMLEEGAPLTQSLSNMLDLGRIPLSDFTEARILISQVVIRLVCERATEEDFAALDRDVERTAAATQRGELGRDTSYITDFYDLLAASTGNQMLRYITHSIAELLSRIINKTRPNPINDMLDLRRKLIASLRARDAETASALLSHHLVTVHQRLVDRPAL